MAEELGKIDKPEAGRFTGKRKLCVVPLLFSGEGAPTDYIEKCDIYWAQVRQHLDNLESRLGMVNHLYHESIVVAGEEGLKLVERLSPSCYQIALDKCQSGAVFEATEDKELAEECMDWERSLVMGFISQKVARLVSDFYLEVARKRYEYIARRIDETLKENEVGVLFVREGHRVQFPPDVEVFSVVPPALDEIHRWQRQQSE